MNTKPQLTIELVWEDVDVEELLISASNGRYAGTARVYFVHGDIEDLANRIRGFPLNVSQVVYFSGDQRDASAHLTFHCVDGAGHASATISLAQAYQSYSKPTLKERVEFDMPFEASALDAFWYELTQVAKRITQRAVLLGIDE
jgi:hypothetical protein